MFSYDKDAFQLKENELLFEDLCQRLKSHPFESPWKNCFVASNENHENNCSIFEFNIPDSSMLCISENDQGHLTSDDASASSCSPENAEIDEDKLSILQESLMSIQESSAVGSIKQIDIFKTLLVSQVPKLCEKLNNSFSNEFALILFFKTIMSFETPLSIAIASSLVHHILYPKVFGFKQKSSRTLLATILNFSEVYPKAAIDEIVIPGLKKTDLELLQVETLIKLGKTHLPNEYVIYCMKNILEHTEPNENVFLVLQNLMDRKIGQEQHLTDILTHKMQSWSFHFNKNVKFTKLVISVLGAYGSILNEQQVTTFQSIINNNDTIMKRAAENMLKKLVNV